MVGVVPERRIFERFSARFPVKFRHSRQNFGTNVFLRDASAEGARISTKEKLYLNDSVSIEVDLPDGKNPLVMNGEVIWVKPGATNLWDIGLRFHKIELMKIRRMFDLVESAI